MISGGQPLKAKTIGSDATSLKPVRVREYTFVRRNQSYEVKELNNNQETNCRNIVNIIWPHRSNDISAEISCREFLSARLAIDLFGYPEYFRMLLMEDYRQLINTFEQNETFRSLIIESIQRTQLSFKKFINKFGNYNGFFAIALLNTRFEDPELLLIRENILSWYFDDARIELTRLRGGSVNAWFPFKDFSDLFSEISASMVTNGIYDSSKQSIKYILNKFSGGKKIPTCISKYMSNNNEEDMINQLGLTYREKLFIFGLSEGKLDFMENACLISLQNLYNEMGFIEIIAIQDLINQKTVSIDKIGRLQESGLVKIVEFSEIEKIPVVFPMRLNDFA